MLQTDTLLTNLLRDTVFNIPRVRHPPPPPPPRPLSLGLSELSSHMVWTFEEDTTRIHLHLESRVVAVLSAR